MKSYNEWQYMPNNAPSILKKVQLKIRSIVPNADIVLYGSRVRGDANKDSDWDFLILVDQTVKGELVSKLRDSLYDIELETDEVLSSIIRSKQDWNSEKYSILPFKRVVEQEGILL